jgi:ribosomal protein S27AE
MAATNYKVDKPTNCTRCGKAIVQTKHGRRIYCYRCRVDAQQENQHSYWVRRREANPNKSKKNCSIDWQLGDKMIKDGEDPQVIADTLGCSVHTVLSHRSNMKHGKLGPGRVVSYGCTFFDYKGKLDAMIAKLHKARGNSMDLAQFRKWLMTPPGQYVLASINEALRQQEGWEQRFMDYSTGWRNRARQGNA